MDWWVGPVIGYTYTAAEMFPDRCYLICPWSVRKMSLAGLYCTRGGRIVCTTYVTSVAGKNEPFDCNQSSKHRRTGIVRLNLNSIYHIVHRLRRRCRSWSRRWSRIGQWCETCSRQTRKWRRSTAAWFASAVRLTRLCSGPPNLMHRPLIELPVQPFELVDRKLDVHMSTSASCRSMTGLMSSWSTIGRLGRISS